MQRSLQIATFMIVFLMMTVLCNTCYVWQQCVHALVGLMVLKCMLSQWMLVTMALIVLNVVWSVTIRMPWYIHHHWLFCCRVTRSQCIPCVQIRCNPCVWNLGWADACPRTDQSNDCKACDINSYIPLPHMLSNDAPPSVSCPTPQSSGSGSC